jgi:hypothetical protein
MPVRPPRVLLHATRDALWRADARAVGPGRHARVLLRELVQPRGLALRRRARALPADSPGPIRIVPAVRSPDCCSVHAPVVGPRRLPELRAAGIRSRESAAGGRLGRRAARGMAGKVRVLLHGNRPLGIPECWRHIRSHVQDRGVGRSRRHRRVHDSPEPPQQLAPPRNDACKQRLHCRRSLVHNRDHFPLVAHDQEAGRARPC